MFIKFFLSEWILSLWSNTQNEFWWIFKNTDSSPRLECSSFSLNILFPLETSWRIHVYTETQKEAWTYTHEPRNIHPGFHISCVWKIYEVTCLSGGCLDMPRTRLTKMTMSQPFSTTVINDDKDQSVSGLFFRMCDVQSYKLTCLHLHSL